MPLPPMSLDAESRLLSLREVEALAARLFAACGASEDNSAVLAQVIVKAERDGLRSHGLGMLPAYASTLRSGWANGAAVPSWHQAAASVIRGDGGNGFAQLLHGPCLEPMIECSRDSGLALLAISNAHHIGALGPDVEPYAEAGLVAIAMVNSRPFLVPWGGTRPVFGTNPMAFAAPRKDGPPIMWDQASCVMAISDIRQAAAAGMRLGVAAGLSAAGEPSDDPAAIAESGRVLPFAEHKGTAIALMVEILAGALSGASLAVEDRSAEHPGAASGKGGQIIIVIDPACAQDDDLATRLVPLLEAFENNGSARLPGDGRLARRARHRAEGVVVPLALLDRLEALVEGREGEA